MTISLDHMNTSRPCQWRGSYGIKFSDQFLEPIKWKGYHAKSSITQVVLKGDPKAVSSLRPPRRLLAKDVAQDDISPSYALYSCNCTIWKTRVVGVPEGSHKSCFLADLSTMFASCRNPQKQTGNTNSVVYPDGPLFIIDQQSCLNLWRQLSFKN